MESISINELEVSKKSLNWTNYFCPVCQKNHNGGRNGKFIVRNGFSVGNCVRPTCRAMFKITDNILQFNKKTMTKIPVFNKELRETFSKGKGNVGSTATGRKKIEIFLKMKEGFADSIVKMAKIAENNPKDFKKIWIPKNKENIAKILLIEKDVPSGTRRPNFSVICDNIAVFNKEEPLWTEEKIEKCEDLEEKNREKFASFVGAFWYIKDDNDDVIFDKNGSYFLSGNIDIKKTLASGDTRQAKQSFVIEVKKTGEAEIFRKNNKLFNEDNAEIEENIKENIEASSKVTKKENTPEIVVNQGQEDEITADNLPF